MGFGNREDDSGMRRVRIAAAAVRRDRDQLPGNYLRETYHRAFYPGMAETTGIISN